MNPIVKDVMTLLEAMGEHATKERTAIIALDTRTMFELAAAGESLARSLGDRLAGIDAETLATPEWSQVRARAASLKAMRHSSAAVAKRTLDIVRALRSRYPVASDAPAFVSQRA